MNIIYLTPYLPAPDSHGCASKNWDDLSVLSRGNVVHVVCFVSETDRPKLKLTASLPNVCVYPVCVDDYARIPAISVAVSRLITDLVSGGFGDILQCECSFMARNIPAGLRIPMILTEHQVYWLHFWREFVIRARFLSFARMLKNITEEFFWLKRFKAIIFFSDHDKKMFRRLLEKGQLVKIIPLSVDCRKYVPAGSVKKYDICFLGDFASYANVDAAEYLLTGILPVLNRIIPGVTCAVAGGHMPEGLKRLALSRGADCPGYVENVPGFLSACRIFVNPMRLGSGMRRKVLEAWACGVPVVSTSTGAEGLGGVDGRDLLIADDPASFSSRIRTLLSDSELAERTAKAGLAIAAGSHDKNRVGDMLNEVYREVLSKR